MQDNKLYRPPAGSLLDGSSQTKTPHRTSFIRRFVVTLLWAFPLFILISFYRAPVTDWLGLAIGSLFIALVSALIAMLIPTHFKSIYVTIGTLAGLGLALLTASH